MLLGRDEGEPCGTLEQLACVSDLQVEVLGRPLLTSASGMSARSPGCQLLPYGRNGVGVSGSMWSTSRGRWSFQFSSNSAVASARVILPDREALSG